MAKGKKWTKREEKVLLNAVTDYPQNLSNAFMAASHVLSRSSKACEGHWYTVLSKKENEKGLLLITPKKGIVNRKNSDSPIKKKHRKSKIRRAWNAIIKIFSE